MMEGYFVRTLGMHRVYNSAFMNMLKNEENANYRSVMKNTLEFNPEILKRFVNFMNNPDEDTAVAQFGKGDKYFGVCTLMATLPGLPMFGHGQVEGFTEKYGMEYRRAYRDEQPDEDLVQRHEREIFPLLRAGVCSPRWSISALRLLHSGGPRQRGCVRLLQPLRRGAGRWWSITTSMPRRAAGFAIPSAIAGKTGKGEERRLTRNTLGPALGLPTGDNHFCIFRDQVSGLEYIRSARELQEQGLYVELNAYTYHVFLDFRTVQDNASGQYAGLAASLNGRGVPDMAEAA